MRIYYESSRGEIVNFDEWPVSILDITPLFKKGWSYDITENIYFNNSTLNKLYRTKTEISLDVSVFADSAEEYINLMNTKEFNA